MFCKIHWSEPNCNGLSSSLLCTSAKIMLIYWLRPRKVLQLIYMLAYRLHRSLVSFYMKIRGKLQSVLGGSGLLHCTALFLPEINLKITSLNILS